MRIVDVFCTAVTNIVVEASVPVRNGEAGTETWF